MKRLIAAAIICAAPIALAADTVSLDAVAGVYKFSFQNAMADGTKYRSEDILEIVKVDPHRAYVRADLQFANGHACKIYGVAGVEGDSLVYRTKTTDHRDCTLTLRFADGKITFHDQGQACRVDTCGARGLYDGMSFAAASRRPIGYMPRLLASREYAEAMAATGAPAPPPNVTVTVAPMHTKGADARYPRLVAFPEANIRAKINAYLAKAEAHDRREHAECVKDQRANNIPAEEAEFSVGIDVTYVTARYLSIHILRSDYCGGPYPNDDIPSAETLDLSTGSYVEWQSAFKPGFLNGRGGDSDGRLAALYRARYAKLTETADPDCKNVIADGPIQFVYWLDAKKGFVAIADLPHATQACAEEIAFSPAEIAPYVQDARFIADLNATVRK